jgi:hypothetical protein
MIGDGETKQRTRGDSIAGRNNHSGLQMQTSSYILLTSHLETEQSSVEPKPLM